MSHYHESLADLYAKLTEEQRAELSYEERMRVEDQIFEEAKSYRYMRNIVATVGVILLALFMLYTGGGHGYGRYTADAYDWMLP